MEIFSEKSKFKIHILREKTLNIIFRFLTKELAKEARGRRREVPIDGAQLDFINITPKNQIDQREETSSVETDEVRPIMVPEGRSEQEKIMKELEDQEEESLLEGTRSDVTPEDATNISDQSRSLFEDMEMEE